MTKFTNIPKSQNLEHKKSVFSKLDFRRGIATLGTSGLVFGFGMTSVTPALATGEIV